MSTSREDTYRLRILELRTPLSGHCSRTMSALVYAQFQIDEKPIRSACASSYYCWRTAANSPHRSYRCRHDTGDWLIATCKKLSIPWKKKHRCPFQLSKEKEEKERENIHSRRSLKILRHFRSQKILNLIFPLKILKILKLKNINWYN